MKDMINDVLEWLISVSNVGYDESREEGWIATNAGVVHKRHLFTRLRRLRQTLSLASQAITGRPFDEPRGLADALRPALLSAPKSYLNSLSFLTHNSYLLILLYICNKVLHQMYCTVVYEMLSNSLILFIVQYFIWFLTNVTINISFSFK